MSITHELRSSVANYPFRDNRDFELFEAIADRIDAEHERAMAAAALIAGVPMTDENMADHGWIRLPKDADGEYIHIGDVMCWLDEDAPNKVDCMHLCGDGWLVYAHGVGVRSKELRHHHAPTVEDVLDEFASAYDRIGGADEEHQLYLNLIAEYATKLRELAGDGSMEWVAGPISASVLRDAADTIWQLRDDLQRANVENTRLRSELESVGTASYLYGRSDLKAENAKLRELVRDALMPRLLYGIYRCPDEDMPIGDAIEWADSELRSRAEELGVELEMEV